MGNIKYLKMSDINQKWVNLLKPFSSDYKVKTILNDLDSQEIEDIRTKISKIIGRREEKN